MSETANIWIPQRSLIRRGTPIENVEHEAPHAIEGIPPSRVAHPAVFDRCAPWGSPGTLTFGGS